MEQNIRDKFNSRKLAALLWAWLILLTAYDFVSLTPALEAVYSTFVGGVVALYAIYCGANVGEGIWAKKPQLPLPTAPLPLPPPPPISEELTK
jgi:hypothetical protein